MKVSEIIIEQAVKPRIIPSTSGAGKFAVVMPDGQRLGGFQSIQQANDWLRRTPTLNTPVQTTAASTTDPYGRREPSMGNTNNQQTRPAAGQQAFNQMSDQLKGRKATQIVRERAPGKIEEFKKAAGKKAKTFAKRVLVILPLGAALTEWYIEMSSINYAFEMNLIQPPQGMTAGTMMQQMKTDATKRYLTQTATTIATWWAAVRVAATAKATITSLTSALIPGFNIAALLGSATGLILLSGFYYFISRPEVQTYIAMKTLENWAPELFHSVSRTIASTPSPSVLYRLFRDSMDRVKEPSAVTPSGSSTKPASAADLGLN